MARKNDPTSDDQEFSSQHGFTRAGGDVYPEREFDGDGTLDAARFTDDEPEQESPFLRAQKRVPVRKGAIPKKTVNKLKIALVAGLVTFVAGSAVWGVWAYSTKSWRFRVESSDSIQISGNQNVSADEILDVFRIKGGDISKNAFKVPLEERKAQLEQIPWIESATVMRYLPNRLAVTVKERTPIAEVETESGFMLIDANGVLMNKPDGWNRSFPILRNFSDADPLSTRLARIRIYTTLIKEVDGEGNGYSQDFSEVLLTNPEDLRVVTHNNDSVHLANRKFLDQYKRFLALLPQCRARRGVANVDIDLRFKGQELCNPVGAGVGEGSTRMPPVEANTVPAASEAPVVEEGPARPSARPKRVHRARAKHP